VRGYLAGSGWKEYQQNRTVCGVALPSGLHQCDKLPSPIFTPSTKADDGHDENITFAQACEIAGTQCMTHLRERSLRVYEMGAEYARSRGIIIADTKFEWGRIGDTYILIDEVLTPDSSRFWPVDQYEAGRDQDSFDKQYVRNYLTGLCGEGKWDKTPPGPDLPDEIVANTSAKYREALERIIN
jgi:phosphoribosylaminoimidazole-succinocarboxamide synthase